MKRQETYLEAGYTTLSLGDIDADQRNTVLTTCKGGAETPALACMPVHRSVDARRCAHRGTMVLDVAA